MKINLLNDGTCLTCIYQYCDCEHRELDRKRDLDRSKALIWAANKHKQVDSARLCMAHALESDEFCTRFDKADALLAI